MQRLTPTRVALSVLTIFGAGCASASPEVESVGAAADANDAAAADANDAAAADANDIVSTTSLEVGEDRVTTTTSTTTTTTTTVAPTTTTVATTAPMTQLEAIESCIDAIPHRVRIGQLLFPVMVQSEFGEATRLAADGSLGGVVVLGAPDATVVDDIATFSASSAIPSPIVAVDEEGGRVQRLDGLVGVLDSARTVAAERNASGARQLARTHAERIGTLGFTMNLAPVADLDTGPFIRDRSFGADPTVVTDFVVATAQGILDAGLTPTIKHFPGHGAATDSHTGLPTLPPLAELTSDLQPFRDALAQVDSPVMVGHLVVPGLTDGRPATLSPAAIDGLLRTDLGFDGVVMTDALNMDAITNQYGGVEAAELALDAGNDLVMLGRLQDVEPTIDRIVDAVNTGRLSQATIDESFVRVMALRDVSLCDGLADLAPAIACEGVATASCN